MPHLHLDFETFSEVDLNEVGHYRYAFDPSTEILCAAMALDDGWPLVWCKGVNEVRAGINVFDDFWDALEDPDTLIYCHNAEFEMAICQALLWRTWGIKCPDLRRFRCTMSMARRAALPSSLAQLGEVLDLDTQKDKAGDKLIKKFSVMQPVVKQGKPTKKNPQGTPTKPSYRIRPEDDPEAFAQFMQYCAQDVRVEQQVAKRLAYFDEPINNDNFTLTAIINARGVPVNLAALRHANRLVIEETAIVQEQFRAMTGVSFTQKDRFKEWMASHGLHLDNLQKETVESTLEQWEGATDKTLRYFIHPESDCCFFTEDGTHPGTDGLVEEVDREQYVKACEEWGQPLPPEDSLPLAVKALRMYQTTSYAACAKIPTMLACAGPHDNRIRGMLNHHGATTGRWTASLVQFQNMKRPTISNSEDAYREICEGISRDMLEICYGPVLEVISSCIRHFVHDCS